MIIAADTIVFGPANKAPSQNSAVLVKEGAICQWVLWVNLKLPFLMKKLHNILAVP